MPDWAVILIVLPIFSPVLFMGISLIEYGVWVLREKLGKEVDCDCKTPRDWSPLGSTYICAECARYWYSTDDNVCWAGWARAPWWKRAQMKLGWEFKGRRKIEDPPPLPEPQIATFAGKVARLEAKIKARIGQ